MKASHRPVVLAAALAAGFAALVAYALLRVERPDEAARARHEAEARALSFAPGEVLAIAITTRAGTAIRIERVGEAWRLASPRAEAASAPAVDGLLERLGAIRLRATLPAGTKGDAAPGLDPPAARVVLALRDGSTRTLDVGDENPFDRTRYVRAGGRTGLAAGVPDALLDPGLDRQLAPPGGG